MNTENEILELIIVDLLGILILAFDLGTVLNFVETKYVVLAEAILTTVLILYTGLKLYVIAKNELNKLSNKNQAK